MNKFLIAAGLLITSSGTMAGSYVSFGAQAVANSNSYADGTDADDLGLALNAFAIDDSGLTFDAAFEFASGDNDAGTDYDRSEYQLGIGFSGLVNRQMSAYATIGFHGWTLEFSGAGEMDETGVQLAGGMLYRTMNADLRGEIQFLELDQVSWVGFKALGNYHLSQTLDLVAGVQIRQGDELDVAAFYAGLAYLMP